MKYIYCTFISLQQCFWPFTFWYYLKMCAKHRYIYLLFTRISFVGLIISFAHLKNGLKRKNLILTFFFFKKKTEAKMIFENIVMVD